MLASLPLHQPFMIRLEAVCTQVVDRPSQAHQVAGRSYVQPQWVLDSANFRVRADERLYAPGAVPPPHLSPFVEAGDGDYVPDYARSMQQLQVSAPPPPPPKKPDFPHQVLPGLILV